MSIPQLAVKRPVAIFMLALSFLVIGLFALTRLSIALFPDLTFPYAVVVAEYPNVGPHEVESQLTKPLEEAVATVSNVRNVSSISLTGQATVIAEFNWGTDMDFATLNMRERVDQIRHLLPDGVESLRIFRFDPTQEPMFQISLGGVLGEEALRRLAEDEIKPRLERIEGVASVTVQGGREREIRVAVDPTRLEQHGITYTQVVSALAASNLNLPGGRIQENGREWVIRTVGEFARISEIEQVVVHASPNGVVRLGDVATVVDGYKETRQLTRLNGTPSIALSIQRESTGNTVAASNKILAEVEQMQAEYGPDVEIQVVWDEARFIRSSIRSLVENAVLGAVFATVVLFAFLRNWIPTFIIFTTMPTSLISTFALFYFSDTSINMLSLGGLALGVGMLIDNGIVVLENIYRRMELGDPPAVAAGVGAQEVGRALMAATLTTLAVFLPVVFLEGFASELFRDLSYSVSFSIVMSLVVAMTLVPMLAARWLGNGGAGFGGGRDEKLDPRFADPLTPGPGGFGRFVAWYARLLQSLLGRRWVALIIGIVLVGGGVLGASRLGMEFMPETDRGEFTVSIEMPAGTSLPETNRVVELVESYILKEVPDLKTMLSTVGGNRPDRAAINVTLVEPEERQSSTDAVIEQLRRYGATVPGARISVAAADHMGGAGGSAPVQVQVKGENLDQLAYYAERIAEEMRGIRGLREVETSLSESRPELQVQIHRDRAASLGLNVFQVASSIRKAVEGEVGTRFRVSGEEVDVRVQLAESYRSRALDLERLLIDTPLGVQVPLGEVARVVEGESPVEITRDGQERTVRVQAHLFERDLGSAMAEIRERIARMGLPRDISVAYGGQDEMMRDAFESLATSFVLAVILVYMILAAQYESFTQPLIIMLTMPLAVVGAIWGLVVTGWALSVPAFIGVIMVAGIVLNNGIVLVDYTNQLREQGLDRQRALLWAARVRLRPVLMTSVTTVLAMLPLALGFGEGSEIQAPIAVVTIAGLSLSTVLTLGLVPTFYSVVDDVEQWVARVLFRRGRRRNDPVGPSAVAGAD